MAFSRFPVVPASFFGMVLGLCGLGGAWRAAHVAWGISPVGGEVVMLAGSLVWLVVLALFLGKWVFARSEALAEVEHPVQCCFIGLAGVATMLVAGAVLPYCLPAALGLFGAGSAFTLGFALWRTGTLWQGGREVGMTTAVLYLPSVAGSFVTAIVASGLGYADWGQLAWGAGFFSWLAIESVLLHRLYSGPTLPAALRPTLGVQLAPGPVCAVAYLAVNHGSSDLFVHALLGYGLLQMLILLRLQGWLREGGMAASWWAFTFGATALATAPLKLVAAGDTGAMATLAPLLFGFANALVLGIAAVTLWLLVQGKLVTWKAR